MGQMPLLPGGTMNVYGENATVRAPRSTYASTK